MITIEIKEKRQRNKESVKTYQQGRDAIMLRPSKEDGEIIRNAAKKAGQSVQAYILQAIRYRMDSDTESEKDKLPESFDDLNGSLFSTEEKNNEK